MIVMSIPIGIGFYPAESSDDTISGKLTLIFTYSHGTWQIEDQKEIMYTLYNELSLSEYDVKTYTSMWSTPKFKYGKAANTCCKNSTNEKIEDCINNHPLTNSGYNLIMSNCRDRAKEVLKDCCMEIDESTRRAAQKGKILKLPRRI